MLKLLNTCSVPGAYKAGGSPSRPRDSRTISSENEIFVKLDISLAEVKAEFGDQLSFMGAIDTQHVLPHGTTDDVRREVEQRIADLGPGGGYILAPVHNVQADVPPENLVTMYRHALRVGRYPFAFRPSS